MSYKNKRGVWIVPKEQVKEFYSKNMNKKYYRDLCIACYPENEQAEIKRKMYYNQPESYGFKRNLISPNTPLSQQFKDKNLEYKRKKIK